MTAARPNLKRISTEPAGHNRTKLSTMSIETNRTRKSSLWLAGEDCKGETIKSSQALQRSGGVGGYSMLGRECGGSWEISNGGRKLPTGSTTPTKEEAHTAIREVGVLRSSNEVPAMGMEQRRGSCANAPEAVRERIDGLKRKITLARGLTWDESLELKKYERKCLWKHEAPTTQKAEPMTKVRKLQRALYRQAKNKPTWKAWTLYGDLCSRELLEEALCKVIANKGKPGIDGQSVEELRDDDEKRELWLTRLEEDLRNKTYVSKPIRRVFIPKGNGGKEMRPLGIPIVTS